MTSEMEGQPGCVRAAARAGARGKLEHVRQQTLFTSLCGDLHRQGTARRDRLGGTAGLPFES